MAKQYGDVSNYEAKLERVMNRLGVEQYNYDWSRYGCWVEFWLNGQLYRFDHSVENAKAHGVNVKYGSDVFAQVVLTLEDIARMTERGIYELQTWVSGLKALPEAPKIPECFLKMQFDHIPSMDELKKRYRTLAKTFHPDLGGSQDEFEFLEETMKQAVSYLEGEK